MRGEVCMHAGVYGSNIIFNYYLCANKKVTKINQMQSVKAKFRLNYIRQACTKPRRMNN